MTAHDGRHTHRGHEDGLRGPWRLVRERMRTEPRSKALFVFVGERGYTMKVLTWDGTGPIVVHKSSSPRRWPKLNASPRRAHRLQPLLPRPSPQVAATWPRAICRRSSASAGMCRISCCFVAAVSRCWSSAWPSTKCQATTGLSASRVLRSCWSSAADRRRGNARGPSAG